MKKLPVTRTLEMSTYQLANMRRLENISENHLRSVEKLETEMEKLPATRTLEVSRYQLANM